MYMKIAVVAIAIAAAVASTTSLKADDYPNVIARAVDTFDAGKLVDITSFSSSNLSGSGKSRAAIISDGFLVLLDVENGLPVSSGAGIPTVDEPDRLVIADIDCDGNDDVVVLGRTGQVAVHFLDENAEPIGDVVLVDEISTDDLLVTDLAVADLNNDGKPEIVVAALNLATGTVEFITYINDTTGSFGPAISESVSLAAVNPFGAPKIVCPDDSQSGTCVYTSTSGDAGDGDSACEAVACDYDADTSTWTCANQSELPDCAAGDNVDMTGLDSDGDGEIDAPLLISPMPVNQTMVTTISVNADGTLGPPIVSTVPIEGADVIGLDAGDADGDGIGDAQLLTITGVTFLTGQSDGTFEVADEVGLPAAANGTNLLTFEDEGTGESGTLLASALNLDNTISITVRLSGDGEPVNFIGEVSIDPGDDAEAGDSGAVATGAINQDGNGDVALIRKDDTQGELVQTQLFNGSGTTGDLTDPDLVFFPIGPIAFKLPMRYEDLGISSSDAGTRGPAGPFDRVVLAATAEDSAGDDFILFTFDDDGTLDGFAPGTTSFSFFGAIGVGDLNADGRDDLAVMDRTQDLRIFLNNNDGSFSEAQVDGGDVFAGGLPPASGIRIADLVGDATPEVFFFGIGNTPAPGIVQHDGDGTFSFVQFVGDENDFDQFVRDIATGDVNGDGLVDAVYTVAADTVDGASEMRVFLNNGGGFGATFTAFDAGSNPLAIELADADGDGDLDALVTNTATTTAEPRSVSLLRNDGGANFAAPVQFGTRGNPVSLATADLDGVNGPELIIGSVDDAAVGFPEGVSILTNLPGPIIFIDGFEDVPNSP